MLLLEVGERTIGRALCATRKWLLHKRRFETLEHECQLALPALVLSMRAIVSLILQSAVALVEKDEREFDIAIPLSIQNVMKKIGDPSVSCKSSTHASVSSSMAMLTV